MNLADVAALAVVATPGLVGTVTGWRRDMRLVEKFADRVRLPAPSKAPQQAGDAADIIPGLASAPRPPLTAEERADIATLSERQAVARYGLTHGITRTSSGQSDRTYLRLTLFVLSAQPSGYESTNVRMSPGWSTSVFSG